MYKILFFLFIFSLTGCATERTVTYKGFEYKVVAATNAKAEKLAKAAYEKEKNNLIEQRKQHLAETLPVGTKLYRYDSATLNIYNGKDCSFNQYEYFAQDNNGEIPYIVEEHFVYDYELKKQDENPYTECILISLSSDNSKKYTVPINKDYVLEGITKENWVEQKKIAEQKQREQDKQECDKIIKENKCQKELWNAYYIGHSINQDAKKYKLTPYKTFWGSAYDKRNIGILDQIGINLEYFSSLSYIPEVCSNAYKDNEKLKEQYFNSLIKNWDICYKKLK